MIKISEKYFLDADSHNFTLTEKVINKDKETGEETTEYNPLGYYVSIESALKGIVKTELRKFIGKPKIQEIDSLLKEIDKLNKFFEKSIKEVK